MAASGRRPGQAIPGDQDPIGGMMQTCLLPALLSGATPCII